MPRRRTRRRASPRHRPMPSRSTGPRLRRPGVRCRHRTNGSSRTRTDLVHPSRTLTAGYDVPKPRSWPDPGFPLHSRRSLVRSPHRGYQASLSAVPRRCPRPARRQDRLWRGAVAPRGLRRPAAAATAARADLRPARPDARGSGGAGRADADHRRRQPRRPDLPRPGRTPCCGRWSSAWTSPAACTTASPTCRRWRDARQGAGPQPVRRAPPGPRLRRRHRHAAPRQAAADRRHRLLGRQDVHLAGAGARDEGARPEGRFPRHRPDRHPDRRRRRLGRRRGRRLHLRRHRVAVAGGRRPTIGT